MPVSQRIKFIFFFFPEFVKVVFKSMGLGLFNYLMFFHPPCLRTDFNCPFENVRVSLKLAVSQSQDDLETFSTSV